MKKYYAKQVMELTGISRWLLIQWREAGKVKGKYDKDSGFYEYPESEIEKIKKLLKIKKDNSNLSPSNGGIERLKRTQSKTDR